MKKFSLGTVVCGLTAMVAAGGCGGRLAEEQVASRTETLRRAADCGDLLALLQEDLRAKVDEVARCARTPESCQGQMVTGWARDESLGSGGTGSGNFEEGGNGAPPAPAAPGKGGDGKTYTGTNNQVAGVDEADLVKTDGEHIWLLHQNTLRTISAAPQSLAIESSLDLGKGRPMEMFVGNGRAVVFSAAYRAEYVGAYGGGWGGGWERGVPEGNVSNPAPTEPGVGGTGGAAGAGSGGAGPAGAGGATGVGGTEGGGEAGAGGAIDDDGGASEPADVPAKGAPYPGGYEPENAVKISVVRIGGGAPELEREFFVPGGYVSARLHGAAVRMIANEFIKTPELPAPDFWDHGTGGGDEETQPPWTGSAGAGGSSGGEETPAGAGGASAGDKTFPDPGARTMTVPGPDMTAIDAWVAKAYAAIDAATLGDWLFPRFQGEQALATRCGDFYAPAAGSTDFGVTSIVTLDLNSADLLGGPSILGGGSTVYANADTLLLTHPEYFSGTWDATHDTTMVHAFALSSSTDTAYVASGPVPGMVGNQFALDAAKGRIRVATTVTEFGENWSTHAEVVVLGQDADALVQLGTTGPMAEGERIFSARYVKDKAYVVTFRQTDPLFVVDLASGDQPKVLGQLEIPGFSTYMHPLDATHLLTIGRNRAEDGWSDDGLALKVFDVTNPMAPKLAAQHIVRTADYGYSAAEAEHKAFTFYAEKGLLAIPYEGWADWKGNISTLEVFNVSTAKIGGAGSIDHSDYVGDFQANCGGYCGTPMMRRGLFIEDDLYSISVGAVLVHDIHDLSKPIAVLPLK